MNQDLTEYLDPEIREPIRQMMAQMPPADYSDIPASREKMQQQIKDMKKAVPDIPGLLIEDRMIPGPEGDPDIMVRIYRPETETGILPGFLWIHGGGYILGDVDSIDAMARQLTLAANCVTVSVEYRLAPENPHPAPVEDCYAALKWMAAHTDELKIDPARIAVGGGSAGGGLAAGLALLARDRGEIDIMYQLLIYPMIDDRTTGPANGILEDALFWTRATNHIGWQAYLGCEPGGDIVSCYAAASRAETLAGLPAAYIAVGDQDLFAEEDIDYARRLIVAGVSTELHVYPGGCHSFDGLVPDADISKRFTADIHRALKRALHG